MHLIAVICSISILLIFLVNTFRRKRTHADKLLDLLGGPSDYPLLGNHDLSTLTSKTNKTFEKSDDYEFIRKFYGNGLATINDVNMWKKRRRLLLHSVNLKIMGELYLDTFDKFGKELLQELEIHANTNDLIDLWPMVHNNINRIFFAAFMRYGKKDEAKINIRGFTHALVKGLKIATQRIYYPWVQSDAGNSIYNWITGNDKIFKQIDDEKKQMYENVKRESNLKTNNEVQMADGSDHDYFIDALRRAETSGLYPSSEIMDEIMTFLIGSTETSSVNICFTLLMLAMHPDIQDRVYEEITNTFDKTEDLKLEKLDQLVYLDQCINETLRLFPSIPFIIRYVDRDISVQGDKIIPAGCAVVLGIIGIHRNPKIYNNPDVWNPDRFAPEEVAKRHSCSFVPFSVGARNCLAAKMGLLLIKSQLISVLRKYRLTTNMTMSDIQLDFDVDLRNTSGFHISLQPRLET